MIYEFDYTSVYCVDYGEPWHALANDRGKVTLEFDTDEEALAEATADRYQGEYRCRGYDCGANGHHHMLHSITRVETVVEGNTETITRTKLDVPHRHRCACGKEYWPARGEKACHALVEAQ